MASPYNLRSNGEGASVRASRAELDRMRAEYAAPHRLLAEDARAFAGAVDSVDFEAMFRARLLNGGALPAAAAPAPAVPPPAVVVVEDLDNDVMAVAAAAVDAQLDVVLIEAQEQPQTPLERYTHAVHHAPLDVLPPAARAGLVAALGDYAADLAVLRTLSPEDVATVVHHTRFYMLDRSVVDVFPLLGVGHLDTKISMLTNALTSHVASHNLTLGQLEFLVRETHTPGSRETESADRRWTVYRELYRRNPIRDWPSQASVEHLRAVMSILYVDGCNQDIDLVHHIVSRCTFETKVEHSHEVDAMLTRLFADDTVVNNKRRTNLLFDAIEENWPDIGLCCNTFCYSCGHESVKNTRISRANAHNKVRSNLRARRANEKRLEAAAPPRELQAADDHSTDVAGQQCVVCMDKARRVLLLPCTHLCLCASCYLALPGPRKCPVCKAAVASAQPARLP